jgi:hypothetical protein
MANGNDTRYHEGRMVPKERWLPVSEGSHTGPLGQMFAQVGPNDRGISLGAWQGPQGHHGTVHHEYEESYGGGRGAVEERTYTTGNVKTPRRARIAAEALGNRVEAGADVSKYESSSYTERVRNPRYPRT